MDFSPPPPPDPPNMDPPSSSFAHRLRVERDNTHTTTHNEQHINATLATIAPLSGRHPELAPPAGSA